MRPIHWRSPHLDLRSYSAEKTRRQYPMPPISCVLKHEYYKGNIMTANVPPSQHREVRYKGSTTQVPYQTTLWTLIAHLDMTRRLEHCHIVTSDTQRCRVAEAKKTPDFRVRVQHPGCKSARPTHRTFGLSYNKPVYITEAW